jgi:hypothetical protein
MRCSTPTILLLGALAVVAMFMVIRSPDASSRQIGVGVKSYERWTAVVTLTNLSRFQLFYGAKLERKTDEGWPNFEGYIPRPVQSEGTLRPGEATTLTVSVVNYAQAYPWRVSVFYFRPSPTSRIRPGIKFFQDASN